jgi:surfactin synthase thioesterase subunit
MDTRDLGAIDRTKAAPHRAEQDIVSRLSVRAGTVRLFCLPCAGGRISAYRHLGQLLPDAIEVFGLQAPAPRERSWERVHDSMEPLVRDLLAALRPYLDRPFAFLGHSMGALVAHELSQRLALEGAPPSALFVVAARAPHVPARRALHTLSGPEMWASILELGGITRELLRDPTLSELLIPGIRSDLAVCESYTCEPRRMPLAISAFRGIRDPSVLESELLAWGELCTEGFRLRRLAGNHFCIAADQNGVEIARAVASDLSTVLGGGRW